MRVMLLIVASALAACETDVKEGFLDDLDGVDATATDSSDATTDGATGTETTATSDGTATETSADSATAGDAADTADPGDTAPDVTTDAPDATVTTDVPVGSDVVVDPDALEGLGWHAVMTDGLDIDVAPIVWPGGIAVAVGNGSAIELRAWDRDGDGLFAATLFTGVAPVASGGVACGGMLYVAGNEPDGTRAFVARFDPELSVVRVATFYPKTGTTGGRVELLAPYCGGPGAYVQLEPVGDVTYRAHPGGVVQLTADQTLNRSFLVDLVKVFSDVGTLGTVSADKIRMLQTAVSEPGAPFAGPYGPKIFYIGEVRVPKQLGDTTLQPGDQLVYAHDYTDASGGTATNTAWYGDNDLQHITAASDGRFAVAWRAALPEGAGQEQRVTAFDAEGQQIGTAVVPIAAPITRLRWVGEELVLAGTFTGAPPFPGANLTAGVWLGRMQVGAGMTVVRSAAFGADLAFAGPLHRVALAGTCPDVDAWGLVAVSATDGRSLRVVALGDDGSACTSARVRMDAEGDAGLGIAPLDPSGEYAASTSNGVTLTLGGGSSWPAGSPAVYLGLVRARAGYPAP